MFFSLALTKTVLASSMKLEYPLNDAMPKIEQRRDQLLAKVFDFKQNSPDAHLASDDDYELLYAYGKFRLLSTTQIVYIDEF